MTYTVFLDRDGVFNHHPKIAVRSPQKLALLPGVVEAFAKLNRPDVQTSLVTNQPTVGMGLNSSKRIRRVNEHLQSVLAEGGGRLDHIEAAHAFFNHRRRKPNPGMLEDAATKFAAAGSPVDKKRAIMIGDKPKDAMAGSNFGIPTILVATTYSHEVLQAKSVGCNIAAIVDDLPAAIDWLLRNDLV